MLPTATSQPREVKQQLLADTALAATALVWGSSFVQVKDILEQVTPLLWLAVRFCVGAVALALLMVVMRRWSGLTLRELRAGGLIGLFVWAGYALQTLGLQGPGRTTASNAGFITGMSVVLVPPLALLLLKQRPHRFAIMGVAMAALGLALLSLRFEEGLRLNSGDVLVAGCALAWACQIVLVARVAPWADPLRLALIQILVAGVLSAITASLFEQPVSGLGADIWAGAAYLGIVATSLAILVQASVQRFTTAVHTALIYTLEPMFAAAFGVWLQGDRLGPVAIIGAILILGGMLVAELGPRR